MKTVLLHLGAWYFVIGAHFAAAYAFWLVTQRANLPAGARLQVRLLLFFSALPLWPAVARQLQADPVEEEDARDSARLQREVPGVRICGRGVAGFAILVLAVIALNLHLQGSVLFLYAGLSAAGLAGIPYLEATLRELAGSSVTTAKAQQNRWRKVLWALALFFAGTAAALTAIAPSAA